MVFPGCALSSVNIAWIISMLLVTWLLPSSWSPFYVMQLGHQPCKLGVLECRDTNIEVSQGTVFKAAALPALSLSPWCKYVPGRGSLCALRQKRQVFTLCAWQQKGQESPILYRKNVTWSKLLPQDFHAFLSRALKILWATCSSLPCFIRGVGLDGLKRSLLT